MTLPKNGTTKKIVAGVATAVLVFLIMTVITNSNRITAMETQMDSLTKTTDMALIQAERNRVENREEHRIITDKLDGIAKEIRK